MCLQNRRAQSVWPCKFDPPEGPRVGKVDLGPLPIIVRCPLPPAVLPQEIGEAGHLMDLKRARGLSRFGVVKEEGTLQTWMLASAMMMMMMMMMALALASLRLPLGWINQKTGQLPEIQYVDHPVRDQLNLFFFSSKCMPYYLFFPIQTHARDLTHLVRTGRASRCPAIESRTFALARPGPPGCLLPRMARYRARESNRPKKDIARVISAVDRRISQPHSQ